MKLPRFDYRSPDTVDEALALLTEYGEEAKILAGGQSLLPVLAMRLGAPQVLIDINGIAELSGISVNGGAKIAAASRHRTGERSPELARALPILPAALAHVGHDAIRSRGTIGGSVAHADPSAELPTIMRLLDGVIVIRSSRGERRVDAASFYEGFLMTCLEADELVVALEIPLPSASAGWSFDEVSRRSGDFALVGCATVVDLAPDGTISDARIGLSGVADIPHRASETEQSLIGATPDGATLAAASVAVGDAINPPADLHGTREYRKHVARGLVRRNLERAVARAKGQD
ncbi:MAG: xanthine dehydrogenase family protein subunit M [Actinobacteria bacterium]|nr:xanthine dehydrogenase family protein subunit M [Actinomycetota bacterium]